MFEDGYQVVPAGLEELPAGAALAAALEGLDPARVSPHDTARLVAAQRRQLAHQQACFHECARQAALADPSAPGGRAPRDVPESADELRVVLSASRTAVARLLDLADAAQRHPRLGAAWQSGAVDEQRVAILVRWTAALSEEHAAAVIEELGDAAGSLTPSRLIDRIQASAKALDPGWAQRWYRRARGQRRVRARCTEAGTVNLSALDLPLEGGVRSVRRVHALAARAQAAGHPGLIDTIRADVVLALLHPDLAGGTDAEIVAAVLAAAHPEDPRPRRTPDPAQAPPDDPTPPDDPADPDHAPDDVGDQPTRRDQHSDGDDGCGDDDQGDDGDGDGQGDGGDDDRGGDDSDDCHGGDVVAGARRGAGPAAGEVTAGFDGVSTGGEAPGGDDHDDDRDGSGGGGAAGGEAGPGPSAVGVARRATRQSRFELRVGLGTLLELDERPARLPGWGVITAGAARELAASYAEAEWRVAVTDDADALIAALLARRRPTHTTTTPQEPPIPGAPRPVVELHVTETALAALRPREHPGWVAILADLQQQLTRWRAALDEDLAAQAAEQAAEQAAAEPRAAERATEQRAATASDPPGTGGRDPDPDLDPSGDGGLDAEAWARVAARRRQRAREALARFPSAALRRWVTMRDRECVFPPCGASALAAEIDHTRAVVDHGLTAPDNLGSTCGHDHDLKDQGWTLTQPRPGWFTWTSPTGHTYHRPPRPVLDDLPETRPMSTPSSTEPDCPAEDAPTWDTPPPPPKPADPPTPQPPPADDDPPPF